jgi:hypothetical protein
LLIGRANIQISSYSFAVRISLQVCIWGVVNWHSKYPNILMFFEGRWLGRE